MKLSLNLSFLISGGLTVASVVGGEAGLKTTEELDRHLATTTRNSHNLNIFAINQMSDGSGCFDCHDWCMARAHSWSDGWTDAEGGNSYAQACTLGRLETDGHARGPTSAPPRPRPPTLSLTSVRTCRPTWTARPTSPSSPTRVPLPKLGPAVTRKKSYAMHETRIRACENLPHLKTNTYARRRTQL